MSRRNFLKGLVAVPFAASASFATATAAPLSPVSETSDGYFSVALKDGWDRPRRSNQWIGSRLWPDAIDQSLASMMPYEALGHGFAFCKLIAIGIEAGGADDFVSLAAVGQNDKTGKWLLWTHSWCLETAIETQRQNNNLTKVVGKDLDVMQVSAISRSVVHTINLLDAQSASQMLIGIHPNCPVSILDGLVAEGADFTRFRGLSNGTLSATALSAEHRLESGQLLHPNQFLLNQAVKHLPKNIGFGKGLDQAKASQGDVKLAPAIAAFRAIARGSAKCTGDSRTPRWPVRNSYVR